MGCYLHIVKHVILITINNLCCVYFQGHYMGGGAGGESGFISAATSGPASQSGHGDGDDLLGGGDGSVHGGTGSEMGGGCYTGGPGSITGSSLYDLDSAHRSGKLILT